ncbi:MAG TPA: NAD(P)/FAD-dependent oxidoreductase [Acidimicrobiales bacterium]|nr:NAD(P)/FAD-dependent oxidoreductase [Acidimicrobiales bacterium]
MSGLEPLGGTGRRWAVVGGGILGLAVARHLRADGHDVTLYEGADDLGGLASAWTIDLPGGERLIWDRYYHVTLLSDLRARGLLDDLGLTDEVRWVETRTGCYADGELYSVSNAVEFLRFPPLGLLDKLRLGGTILYGARIRDGRRMERVGVSDWLRRWSGRRTYERFWLPLLRAKLGESYREASAAFIWSTIQRLYAARRTGLKKEMFGYVHGGYARTIDAFAARLRAGGVDLRTGCPVSSVRREGDGFVIATPSGDERADRVVVTTAAPLASRLCPELDDDERGRLDGARYQGIVCESLVLRRPLAPYYLTNITDPGTPFTAVVEMTSLIDPAEVAGHTLVYLPKYVAPDDPLLDASDEDVHEAFWPYLRQMHPTLTDEDLVARRVSRARLVFAVPTLGYSDGVPPIVTSVPGLYLVGSADLVHATLNVDDTLGLADEAVALISGAEGARAEAVIA